MQTTDFIQLLPATIDRAQILSQMRTQSIDMAEITIPSFKASLDVFGPGYKFRSQAIKNVEQAFVRRRMTQKRVNWVQDILTALENGAALLPEMVKEIERLKTGTIARDGIDLRTANLLQMVEMNSFALDYAGKLLLWAYACEGASLNAHVNADALSRGERNWLTENLAGFIAVIDLYQMPAAQMMKKLDGVAKIPVAGVDFEAMIATNADRVDPLKLGFIGEDYLVAMVNSIAVRLGKLYVEHTVKKHQERKELKGALELRLLEMKMAIEGTTDANLSKRIRYTEDRLSKLSYEIAQYEA
jgi:hypothetical protein